MNLEKIKERLEELESSIDQFERELEIYRCLNLEGLNYRIKIANTYIGKGKSAKKEQYFRLAMRHYLKTLRYVTMIQNFHELYRTGLIEPDYFKKVERIASMGGISCIIMICSSVVLFILTDFVFGFPLPMNPISIPLLVMLIVSTFIFATGFILNLIYERKLTKKRDNLSNY